MDAYTSAKFADIEATYKRVLPGWMAEYEKSGNMFFDPYVRNWLPEFSPIEHNVWSDIRGNGVPFYPQIPVARFFLDFACPMLKIAIECDGKEFHDIEKDAARDEELGSLGWTVYRLQGHECKRMIECPWFMDKEVDHDYFEQLQEWFFSTSAGLVYCLKQKFFAKELDKFAAEHVGYIAHTLSMHRTTPYANVPASKHIP